MASFKIKGPDERTLERIIRKAVLDKADKAFSKLPDSDLNVIGRLFLGKMKTMISSGQNPIRGFGSPRFPEYKAVTSFKTAKKSKFESSTANKIKNRGYPYSVQKSFPDKKPRPVNLFLSGDFIKSLITLVVKKGGTDTKGKTILVDKRLRITFDKEESKQKELGHREGANGQLKRPIIPKGKEDFAAPLRKLLVDAYVQLIKKRIKD